MEQTEAQSIITMSIALISCISAFYLWAILLVRKREYQRSSNAVTKQYSRTSTNQHTATRRGYSLSANSSITIYTQFVFHMAMYQTILSFALMLESVNVFTDYKLMEPSCSWSESAQSVLCFLSRCIITFFLIGSISWYFVITITICSSLFNHRSITNRKPSRIHKYHLIVILISLSVASLELALAHRSADYDFTENTVNFHIIFFIKVLNQQNEQIESMK